MVLDWLEDYLLGPCCFTGPCFSCDAGKSKSQPLRTLRSAASFEVELAVSPLAGLRGFGGYHTSVLIAGEEYYFSPTGIHCCSKVHSHPKEVMVKIFIGHSSASGAELLCFLEEHFQEGSYDLLRKNCNAFTDCALYFLCERRLDLQYRAVEQLAWMADDHTGIMQSLSHGEYSPNPLAEEFDLQVILQDIDLARDWDTDSESEDLTVEVAVIPPSSTSVFRAHHVELPRKRQSSQGAQSSGPSVPSGEEFCVQRL